MAPFDKKQRRYDTVTVRVSRVEKARLYAAAAEADVTVSQYLRTLLGQATNGSR